MLFLPSFAESHACLHEAFQPARRTGTLAGGRRQARALRPWMNAMWVPLEAHKERSGYASEGFAFEACGGAMVFSP